MEAETDGLAVVLDGLLEMAQFEVGVAADEIGVGVPGVESEILVVVLDGTLVLPQVRVGVAPVVVLRLRHRP